LEIFYSGTVSMGQAQSDTAGEQREAYYGVVISPQLLEQLDRRQRPKAVARGPAEAQEGGQTPRLHVRQPIGFNRGEGVSTDSNGSRRRVTLIESTRKGELLLKHEEQEVGKIQAAAEEMIEKHYSVEQKPLPCGPEREDCIKCLTENATDPLFCQAQVAAFTACGGNAK